MNEGFHINKFVKADKASGKAWFQDTWEGPVPAGEAHPAAGRLCSHDTATIVALRHDLVEHAMQMNPKAIVRQMEEYQLGLDALQRPVSAPIGRGWFGLRFGLRQG